MVNIEKRTAGTEFRKYGDIFTPIEHNEEMNTWLYKRTPFKREGGRVSYEVIKGNTYPSTNEFRFGRGVYTPIYEKAKKYLNNGVQRLV